MRRAELALALALTGCMRIDSYPELPDLTVSWFTIDTCTDQSVTVRVVAPDGELAFTTSAPCTQESIVFVDVARVRYHVTATLATAQGDVVSTAEDDADLRNGFDKASDLFFPTPE